MSSETWNHEPSDSSTQVTGTMINYLIVCERKLWLFSRGIVHEQGSEYVRLGRLIHERSYSREQKEVLVQGRIKIDHTSRGDRLIIHEVKKSRAHSHAARLQLLFYLYELEKLGISCKGELHYRGERRKEPIVLDDESKDEVSGAVNRVVEIVLRELPPAFERTPSCNKCAYADYCKGG